MASKKTRPQANPPTQGARAPKPTQRLPAIDALRGLAILAMFAYHFAFDLNYFAVIRADFNHDWFWLTARTLILSSFLALVGMSLALGHGGGFKPAPFLKRIGLLAGCAALVSIGSYLIFPHSWIYFGVLHFILVASVLGLLALRFNWANLALGAALIALGNSVKLPLFDMAWLNWFGLMTHKPVTEDYVPLLPWFGVVLIGIFLGRRVLDTSPSTALRRWQPTGSASRILALAGRHSLLLYMLHQPVFIGLLFLLVGRK